MAQSPPDETAGSAREDQEVNAKTIRPGEITAPSAAPTAISLKAYIILVAAGAFATTFAQQRVLGNYPTTFLLKDHLLKTREEVSFFFFIATFAWNLKPLAGVLTDAFPFLGTRRKSYMVLGSIGAGILWLVMSLFPGDYNSLLAASIGMNIATVFASTVMGGLMVEAGQRFGASGRVSSLRQAVQSLSQIAGPILGGYLAAKMLVKANSQTTFHAGWWTLTMAISAVTVFVLAVITLAVLREPRAVRPSTIGVVRPEVRVPHALSAGLAAGAILATVLYRIHGWEKIGISLYALVGMFILIIALLVVPTLNPTVVKAQVQLQRILDSRTLWMAVLMLFLVYTVPGLNTGLTYLQEDVMGFKPDFIGRLASIEGAFGVAAAILYAAFCRKLNLRMLLVGGVGSNAAVTFLYLLYHKGTPSTTIMAIHAVGGFCVIISELSLMDLAVRSTPSGCEALGFALMMSVRNFGIALSDLLGSKMLDAKIVEFPTLVIINAATTLVILLFVPFLPRAVMSRREGEH